MSEDRRETLDGAIQRYYYACPRCESTATAKIDYRFIEKNDNPIFNKRFKIHKYVCQECCHVFELMNPEDVRELTGWVD